MVGLDVELCEHWGIELLVEQIVVVKKLVNGFLVYVGVAATDSSENYEGILDDLKVVQDDFTAAVNLLVVLEVTEGSKVFGICVLDET